MQTTRKAAIFMIFVAEKMCFGANC